MFYIYKDTKKQLDIAQAHRENSVLYVYDIPWKALPNVEELKQYRDYRFTKEENLGRVLEQMDEKRFVLYLTKNFNQEEMIQRIMDEKETLYSCEMIYSKDYANVYVLEKQM